MKFEDIRYERVKYEDTKNNIIKLLDNMEATSDFEEFDSIFTEINKIRSHIKTMSTYVVIKFSINTIDDYYLSEKKYWDENLPLFESIDHMFYKKVYNTKYKDEFISRYGIHYYKYIETCIKSFDERIIPYLQEENELMSRYTALLSSCKCDFYGKNHNLFSLMAYFGDKDEEKRIKAINSHTKFFEEHELEFDEIFDRLVYLRNKMARIMGYKDFIELGYYRMHRTDYDRDMIAVFRENMLNQYLPKVDAIYKKQAELLGDNINYYNEFLISSNKNPSLIVDGDGIISAGKKMYRELSNETGKFIDYMIDNQLFHVEKSENKAMGGYCTILYDYRQPFIFGNFNGSLDDVDTLTHEFGHAFQVYMSRHETIPELIFPTLDSCEIFSMTMEILTYPWMELFFGEDKDEYIRSHYESFIKFIPYGCLVDDFQHEIYKRPDLSPEDRKLLWRNLEKKYCPHRVYPSVEGKKELDVLERGGYWYRQGHIFKNPFYYIDYVLAEFCALEFKKIMDEDWNLAWKKYLELSKLGGRYSFTEIVKKANIKNPFERN